MGIAARGPAQTARRSPPSRSLVRRVTAPALESDPEDPGPPLPALPMRLRVSPVPGKDLGAVKHALPGHEDGTNCLAWMPAAAPVGPDLGQAATPGASKLAPYTAILATGLMLSAALSFMSGLILDTVTRGRRELKRSEVERLACLV